MFLDFLYCVQEKDTEIFSSNIFENSSDFDLSWLSFLLIYYSYVKYF